MANSVKEVVEYLKSNPMSTETEIQESVWGYYRGSTWESNKKYADLLRRGLRKGLYSRVEIENSRRSKFFYFIKK
tara:strand:+ start:513 stop:737 length:225 start_codon:yes stop_codon:yes gene_type:complete